MSTGHITVVEGEVKDTLRTIFSLQFVYRGSTLHGEYGCFISCTKKLEEIRSLMDAHGMPPGMMLESPSIVMLDAQKLKEVNSQVNGDSFQLKMLSELLEEIHKDVGFSRLAVDRFDLLCEDASAEQMSGFFDYIRSHRIEMLLTVGGDFQPVLSDLCDNYLRVDKGTLPETLFT